MSEVKATRAALVGEVATARDAIQDLLPDLCWRGEVRCGADRTD